MSRSPRYDSPEYPTHVYGRGVARMRIFIDDRDRRRFLRLLYCVILRGGAHVLAFALVGNHFHLVIRCGRVPLSALMHRLLGRYARYFNRRHGRVGHVFQGRFGSRVVRSDAYLQTVIAYVHANPVVAGIVASAEALEDHPWTGHRAVVGRCRAGALDVGESLAAFDGDPERARAAVRRAAASPGEDVAPDSAVAIPFPSRAQLDEARHGTSALLIRSEEIGRILDEMDSRRARRAVLRRMGVSPERVVADVCARMHVSVREVRSGRRRTAETAARAVISALICDGLGETTAVAARATGAAPSTVSRCRERGLELLRQHGWEFDEFLPGSVDGRATTAGGAARATAAAATPATRDDTVGGPSR